MIKNYLKPEVMEEVSLKRDLVYAREETTNPRSGCTTVITKIDTSEDEAKLT